jgi:hypothetical protein
MKALTLTQPWATLVAIGAKRIETRDWMTRHVGELLITASKKFPSDARHLCPTAPFSTALGMETLHTGCALAVVDMIQCWRFDHRTEQLIIARSAARLLPPYERYFGDYTSGRAGFVFRNIRRLTTPIPCRGSLGLWEVPPDVEAEVRRQVAA